MTVIRRAQASDASALANLAERTFRATFSAQNTATDIDLYCTSTFGTKIQGREIQDPNYVTLLAEVDNALSAYAQVRLRSPQPCVLAERPSELLRLYVSGEYLGQGLAHELMPEILATAANNEADVIWLGVWEENPRAIAFYRKYGFEVVGAHDFRLGEEIQRDLIMAIALDNRAGT
ncbi:MAG: GNAT family N-acetyltransferase [Gammaproteobacteria bacterium]|nr:GNAT family N-acetyltransferase [Gammaproteobacteria bacterium]